MSREITGCLVAYSNGISLLCDAAWEIYDNFTTSLIPYLRWSHIISNATRWREEFLRFDLRYAVTLQWSLAMYPFGLNLARMPAFGAFLLKLYGLVV